MGLSLRRLSAASTAEVRFRLVCAARNVRDRARTIVAPPRWPAASHARHRELIKAVADRNGAFPLACPELPTRAALIRSRCPGAAADAVRRANRILAGRYDLLGYRDVPVGSPPDWHADPVHGRRPPLAFWTDVPFLDPSCGDHKIIWELNRHQHWLTLARAYQLTGDRRYYLEFVAQLEGWLRANPPLLGANWASMLELAFRCLSWLCALHLFAPAAAQQRGGSSPWADALLAGLDLQLTQIEHNLSTYFSPNTHLTGEALALYVAGLALPELRARQRRIDLGRSILLEEAERQVRADGGHAELSAHYHRYSTDFYLMALAVAKRAGDRAAGPLDRAARRQAEYLRTIADSTGRLPLTGDDDGGSLFPICRREPADCRDTLATAAVLLEDPALAVSEPPEETLWLCGEVAARLRPVPTNWPSRALADTGYIVMRSDAGDHLVFDAGPHGFLNGGHAHADALSTVLTIRNHPFLVDGGTATYTMNAEARDRFRSTAMHNTVVVHGRSQSLPDGPFRWKTRTNARESICRFGRDWQYAEGHHDAYAPLVHVRQVIAVSGLGWFVVDHLLGRGAIQADAYWHVHPDWRAEAREGAWAFEHGSQLAGMAASVPLTACPDARLCVHAPEYGRIVRAPCVVGHVEARAPCSLLTLATAEPDLVRNAVVETLDITTALPRAWHTSGFRVRARDRHVLVLAAVERDGTPVGPDAAPRAIWGTGTLQTDARVALCTMNGRGKPETILINGREMHTHAVASSVHQTATRELVPDLCAE